MNKYNVYFKNKIYGLGHIEEYLGWCIAMNVSVVKNSFKDQLIDCCKKYKTSGFLSVLKDKNFK